MFYKIVRPGRDKRGHKRSLDLELHLLNHGNTVIVRREGKTEAKKVLEDAKNVPGRNKHLLPLVVAYDKSGKHALGACGDPDLDDTWFDWVEHLHQVSETREGLPAGDLEPATGDHFDAGIHRESSQSNVR